MTKEKTELEVKKKRAKVSLDFKQKVQDNSYLNTNDMNSEDFIEDCTDNKIYELESYFIKKIQIYIRDFEEEKKNYTEQIEKLEVELEESRNSQVELLVKTREMINTIKQQEVKINFFKGKIRDQENGK